MLTILLVSVDYIDSQTVKYQRFNINKNENETVVYVFISS